jgi:hypothetical protein
MAIAERDCRILFQKSGNRCAFPACGRALTFRDTDPTSGAECDISLSDIAHIVARSEDGPRGQYPLSLDRRDDLDNLVLLCKEHHRIIDAQPASYPVEKLRQMRADHEALIATATGVAVMKEPQASAYVSEQLFSTLLPVERMPRFVYSAPCSAKTEEVAKPGIIHDAALMCPFIIRADRLYAFNNLSDAAGPFRNLVVRKKCVREQSTDWWRTEEHLAWYITLLNRTLNKITGRKGLFLDKEHNRYYFQSDKPGEPKTISYKPLNAARSERSVVWQPITRKTKLPRSYWYHLAVGLRFRRVGSTSWALSIRPELRVTKDGKIPLAARQIGSRITSKKAHLFNNDLLEDLQFWRSFLSDGEPRLVCRFGNGQQLIMASSMMTNTILWPGMPEAFKIKFKNVDFEENLFTLADREELNEEYEDELDEENIEESIEV